MWISRYIYDTERMVSESWILKDRERKEWC